MIQILDEESRLLIDCEEGDLAPRHASQLSFWGFSQSSPGHFIGPPGDLQSLGKKVIDYLGRSNCLYELAGHVEELLAEQQEAEQHYQSARSNGRQLKDADLSEEDTSDFVSFLRTQIPRSLKEHQLKAALHLLTVTNGANFSVPGSGKTTVVVSVFEKLRQQGEVDSLFVVGPPSCFGPWRHEYGEVLGREPSFEILAGGDIELRHSKYLITRESAADLYLTTFQTLQRDWEQVKLLFETQGVRFYFVVDEAHYVKQPGGAWANAVLEVAPLATRRVVLTGTPFPHSFTDAFNLFDVIWPEANPIPEETRHRIEILTQKKQYHEAATHLDNLIGPLFYRVRKSDLGLAPQIFHPPTQIQMKENEKKVYDLVLDRIAEISSSDYMRNIDLLVRLRKGRMMRVRQCLSYSALLGNEVTDYNEDLLEGEMSLADIIKHYDEIEMPGKVEYLLELVRGLRERDEKVVIWSNFIRTLDMLRDAIAEIAQVRLIYGATPVEKTGVEEELTRDEIIQEFVDPDSKIDVLLANPAACAESISLHKTCSNAIYYDLSYNCAQYVQSLDRIHRVGGSEDKPSHYYFLQYENTIEPDILENVQRKAQRMSDIIDEEYPIYSLDMFGDEDEIQAYERIFIQR